MTESCKIFSKLSLLALSLNLPIQAFAQVGTAVIEQPDVTVTAAPLSLFSERSALWPNDELSDDLIANETYSSSYRLNSAPGVQAHDEGSPTISIRGSAQADRVLQLYEGIPLNLADGLGASDLFIPNEALGSENILKGPASAFYGTAAMAGAIDHRLRYFERRALRLDLADDGGILGPRSAMLALPVQNQFGLEQGQVTFFQERRPGRFPYTSVSDGSTGRRENDDRDLTRLTAVAEKKIGAWQSHFDLLAAHSTGDTPGSIRSPYAETLQSTATLAALSAERKFASRDTLGFRISDLRMWGLFDRDTPNVSTTFIKKSMLTIDSQNSLGEQVIARTFIDTSTDQLVASYAGGSAFNQNQTDLGQSLNFALTPTLSLQPSYRYRTEVGEWIKSLGLFSHREPFHTWLTYSEGYREPSLSDRFADAPDFKGNAQLQPERSRSVELGTSFERGRRFSGALEGITAKAAVYATRYSNFLDSTELSPNVYSKINSGSAKSDGFEASIDYGIHVWNFGFAFNYMDAENETTLQPLRLSPREQYLLSASQQFGPIIAELRATIWSSYYDFPSNQAKELPPWTSIDFELKSMGFANWEWSAGCLNIFDRPREFTVGYPEPQRRFFASALRYF